MKKLILSLSVLAFSSLALGASLEQEFYSRTENRLELLTKNGLSVKKACFDQTLTQLKLTGLVSRLEDARTEAGYMFQLKNGDVCLSAINLRTMRTSTTCHAKTSQITINAETQCDDTI